MRESAMFTKLIPDEPSSTDEIGPHDKVASQLTDVVVKEALGHSVAILGGWGSGKSTVLNLMVDKLQQASGVDPKVFVYDAWAHQGDALRRSFLDDLVTTLEL